MRYSFILCFVLLIITSGCNREDRVYGSDSPYYYSKDYSKILYNRATEESFISFLRKRDYVEVTTDVDNFSIISKNYAVDSSKVYYKYNIIENVDHSSFSWDPFLGLPKDKNYIYYPEPANNGTNLKIIEGADPDTYEGIWLHNIGCAKWYRDKNNYFYDHKKVNANRETFSFDAILLPFDDKHIFSVNNNVVDSIEYAGQITVLKYNLIRDDKYFYFNAGCDSVIRIIPYMELDKFKYYDSFDREIFRIDDFIYIGGLLFLAGIVDANSFEVLNYSYMRDKNHVYYKNHLIPDVDSESFEILNNQYAKDKYHVYMKGRILTKYKPDDFIEDGWGRFPADRDYGKRPRSYQRWNKDDDD